MAEKIDYQVLATTIMGTISETFKKMCKEKLSGEPTIETKPIEVIDGKMEVSAFKKFAVRCYVSVIHYYFNNHDREKHKPCGSFILYVKESGVMRLLKSLGYLDSDYADEELIKDMCGEFCNVLAGAFKQELKQYNFPELEISVPQKHRDLVPGGIVYPKGLKEYSEVSVYLWDIKPLVIDLTLAV